MNFEKEKKKLMAAKSPEQYIDLSLKSKITRHSKARVTREWLQKRGYNIEDIIYARNRHPYWKKIKSRGSYEKTLHRIKEHDYSKGDTRIFWTEKLLSEFFDLNKKGLVDYELAKKFKTSLPAVNHIRRKFKLAGKILDKQKKSHTKKRILDLSKKSEKGLRKMLAEL
jgi:hypothetical protein